MKLRDRCTPDDMRREDVYQLLRKAYGRYVTIRDFGDRGVELWRPRNGTFVVAGRGPTFRAAAEDAGLIQRSAAVLPVGAVQNVGTSPDRTGPAAASDAGAPDDEEVCCRHCGDSPVIGGDSHDADLCGDCAENVTVCRRCGEIRACDIDTMLCAECDVDPDDLRED